MPSVCLLYFWDTNGTGTGCGTNAPTGTWGVDAFWNTNSGGVGTGTVPWPAGNYAVFSAGNDATGAYSVHVYGTVQVADIHVDLGVVTFDSALGTIGSLELMDGNGDNTNRLLSVGQKDPNAVAQYDVPLTTATNVTRYKRATLILGATNTFTGAFTIEGGLVQCAVPYAFGAVNPLVLANNDTTRTDFNPAWQYTPAVFNTGGLNQQLGTLTLGGTDPTVVRMIDLGQGSGTLSFADSSGQNWGAFTLTITHYALGSTKLRFGTSGSGLTATQLGQIQFADFLNLPAVINANGYVTPNLPRITAITPAGGSVQLVWSTVIGRTYRVWSKDTLNAGAWNDLADVSASDVVASCSDTAPSPTGRYYRVEVLP